MGGSRGGGRILREAGVRLCSVRSTGAGRTITGVVVHSLGVEDVVHRNHVVVHRNHVVVFAQRTAAYSPELLHLATDAEDKAEEYAERTDGRIGLA